MFDKAWCDNFNGGVTVCNPQGIIIYMNNSACQMRIKDGGQELIGQSLFACHPEPSKSILEKMLQKQISNCYSIEKNNLKKLIYQSPIYDENKQYAGFVEIILELPADMQHFIR